MSNMIARKRPKYEILSNFWVGQTQKDPDFDKSNVGGYIGIFPMEDDKPKSYTYLQWIKQAVVIERKILINLHSRSVHVEKLPRNIIAFSLDSGEILWEIEPMPKHLDLAQEPYEDLLLEKNAVYIVHKGKKRLLNLASGLISIT